MLFLGGSLGGCPGEVKLCLLNHASSHGYFQYGRRGIFGITIRHTLIVRSIALRWADATEHLRALTPILHSSSGRRPSLLTTSLLCIEDAQLQTLCASACQKIQLLRATQNNLYVLQYHTDSHCCSPFNGFPLVRYILRWASPASPMPIFCDEQATHIYILNTLLF